MSKLLQTCCPARALAEFKTGSSPSVAGAGATESADDDGGGGGALGASASPRQGPNPTNEATSKQSIQQTAVVVAVVVVFERT